MNSYIKYFTFLLLSFVCFSCQDVIDVDAPSASSRLVIEASLDWEKGTLGNEQTIKLSLSTPYFDTTETTRVVGASVKVTNVSSHVEFIFIDQNDGTYKTSVFEAEYNADYTLEVVYNNETYTAKEMLLPVPEISKVVQSLEGGFNDEVIDVTIFFDDPIEEENYYLIKSRLQSELFHSLEELSDEFVNGNIIDFFFENEEDEDEFMSGDVLDIDLYGISKRYHNYIRLLIEQYNNGGDPYSSTPAAIKGNCINLGNPDKFAFGYFRLTEVDRIHYTIQ